MDTESDPETILSDLPEPTDGRNSIHSVINDLTQTNLSQSSFTIPSLENNEPDVEIKEEVGELYLGRSVDEEMYSTEFLIPEIPHNLTFGQVMGSIPTHVIKSEEIEEEADVARKKTGPKTRTSGRTRNRKHKNSKSKSKNDEKLHKCRYCELKFVTAKKLLHHEEEFHKTYECPECDRKYLKATSLTRHIRQCHTKSGHKTWRCNYCDSKFETSELKFNHEEETHRNFVCTEETEKCDLKFYSSNRLNEHIWRCHKKSEDQDQVKNFTKLRKNKRSILNKYICKICQKRFDTNSAVSRHKSVHMEVKPFQCNKMNCGESFLDKLMLQRHLRKIHGEGEILKPHECTRTECDKKFGTKLQLIVHLRTHTGETPYKCERQGCTRKFYSARALEIHVKSAHTKGPIFPCTKSDCLEKFSSKNKLVTHLRRIHGEGQIVRPYECSECQQKFLQKAQLITHKRRHAGETPYKCELSGCTKKFYSDMALRVHVKRNHTLGDLHPCSFTDCNEEFSTRDKLETHLRRIHGEGQIVRRFECTECEKKFLQKLQLVVHSRIHTGETPEEKTMIKCDLCEKSYAGIANLNVHKFRAHARPEDKKFSCDHCDLKFVMNCDREKHMLTHSTEKRFQCHKCEAMFKTSGSLKNHIIFKHRYDEDVQRQYWGQP